MALDIFIPYWGDPDYMKQTVRSVLAQENQHWKLTIIDDAYPSRDVQEYVEHLEDSRISYVRKPENEGITENYRSCVARASEDVMVILGCDDVLLPNYVDVILNAHEKFPDAAIIQPGVEVIDESGEVVCTLVDSVKRRLIQPRGKAVQVLSGESLAANLLTGDWLYWPSLAFRTDRIREVDFREGFPIIQDLALIMDMVYRGSQLLVVPTVSFQYRRHSESASSAKLIDGSRFAGEREYFEVAAQQADNLGWGRAALSARLRLTSRAHALTLLPSVLRNGDRLAAKTLALHALGK